MNGTREELVRERQMPCDFTHMWNLKKNEQREKEANQEIDS